MRKCEIESCNRPSDTLKLCKLHYKRAFVAGYHKIPEQRESWIKKIDYPIKKWNDFEIGRICGKLKLIQILNKRIKSRVVGLFLCECGKETEQVINKVNDGRIKSCGCDFVGKTDYILTKKWGKLQPIEITSVTKSGRKRLRCICDCGKERNVSENYLRWQKYPPSCVNCIPVHGNTQLVGEISGDFWATIKSGATCRQFEFNITKEYAWDLFLKQNRKCALSGIELVFGKRKDIKTASLDRIDSSKGYIEGNVQWVHKTINRMKWNMKEEDFIMYCEAISEYKKTLKNI